MPIYQPTPDNIARLAGALRGGELVGMPTETVYGLAASVYDERSCRRIFEYKNRPPTDPLIVHVAAAEEIEELAVVEHPETFFRLAALWPGPLTIVLPAKFPPLSRTITADNETVGIRIPRSPAALALLRLSGPLAAPSANKFGHVSPNCASDVEAEFKEHDLSVLDGGQCEIGIESTVLRITGENELFIFRRGGITEVELQQALPNCKISFLQVSQSGTERQAAPGCLLTHYSIKNAFTCLLCRKPCAFPGVTSVDAKRLRDFENTGIINCGGLNEEQLRDLIASLGIRGHTIMQIYDAPNKLFYASLRELERRYVDCCLIVGDSQMMDQTMTGISASLFDRMFRASSGRVLVIGE